MAWLTAAYEFFAGLRWYHAAMLGCLLLGGCVGCKVEQYRPHWLIRAGVAPAHWSPPAEPDFWLPPPPSRPDQSPEPPLAP